MSRWCASWDVVFMSYNVLRHASQAVPLTRATVTLLRISRMTLLRPQSTKHQSCSDFEQLRWRGGARHARQVRVAAGHVGRIRLLRRHLLLLRRRYPGPVGAQGPRPRACPWSARASSSRARSCGITLHQVLFAQLRNARTILWEC